jgi:hypothetical protein
MRTILASGWALTIALGLSAGCSRSGNHENAAANRPPGNEEVQLIGCIGTASGTTHLVLQNVRFVRTGGSGNRNATGAGGISENSWVALEGIDRDELERHVGRQVQVTGALVDTTRATGTSGDENTATPSTGPGVSTPSGDKSQAATDQHHANKVAQEAGPAARDFMPPGPAPQLRVHEISETGGTCNAGAR